MTPSTHAFDAWEVLSAQVFSTSDGSRENVFALSGDGRWIWMSVRIESPRLLEAVRYRLRYRRVGPPTQHAQR